MFECLGPWKDWLHTILVPCQNNLYLPFLSETAECISDIFYLKEVYNKYSNLYSLSILIFRKKLNLQKQVAWLYTVSHHCYWRRHCLQSLETRLSVNIRSFTDPVISLFSDLSKLNNFLLSKSPQFFSVLVTMGCLLTRFSLQLNHIGLISFWCFRHIWRAFKNRVIWMTLYRMFMLNRVK